jgi:hypothetical protein
MAIDVGNVDAEQDSNEMDSWLVGYLRNKRNAPEE